MGTTNREYTQDGQILFSAFFLVVVSCPVSGQTEGDVRLKDGPNAYEGRPEIFHDGVWLSLCYTFSNYYVPGTICKQLGYQSQAAVSYVSSSYGKAPGEIFGQYIRCTSSSTNVSQCSMTDRQDNCDPRYTLGVSCNTTNSATKIRLKGGSTQYEGRIEIFENGVWGTVCRNYHRHTTYIHRDINAHIACRELFGSGYGGTYYPTHETPDRFGILQSGAIQRRYVRCKGNEDSIFDCSFSRGGNDAACYHEMDATVKCFPVPDGCVGYYMSVTGSLTSPGYPAGHNFTEDTVCAWFIQTASGRTLNMSFPDIDAHNQSDSSSYLQVSDRTYYYWRTSYGSLLPNLVSASSYAFIRQTNKAGTFGIDFAASWTPASCDYSSNNLWTTQYTLRSPGYSGVYPTGLDCFYLYRFRKQLSVVVTFNAFHLDDESNGGCQDYLDIFDGHTVSNHTVGRFCNYTRPPTLTMSQHTVLLHFHSDDIIDSTSQGFYISVSGVEPVPVEQNLNASSGLLTSPGYPALYANETDYKWNIVLLPYQSVTLNVSHYKSSVCSGYERLLVYYTDHRGSSTSTSLYCGRTGAVVVSYSNRMQLWLQAVSEVSNGQAFQAMWKTECRRSFSGASGTIMSPDSPNAYPTNQDCSYLITRDTGYYINLTFTSFALDSDLCNDYVQIFDGGSNSFPLLTSPLCGSSLPPVLLSTSNSLWIEFHSDGTTDPSSTGFVATYTSHIKECKSATLTSINGFLASPGYPVQYARFTYCVWTITVPFGIVELTFQDFAVGQKSTYDCYGAQVRVYDGENVDASTVIETLCGAVAVPKIISTGRSLTVVLNSYGTSPTSAIGFQASYKSISSSDIVQHDLFPYGTPQQDSELAQFNSAATNVVLDMGLPFKNKIENIVYIGNNGLVSFGNQFSWPDLPESRKVICVYCAYIDNSDSVGGIYYHQYTSDQPADASVVTKASTEVQEFAETSSFNAHYVMVVTWDRVKQGRYRTVNYDPDDDAGEATFQLALISDGETTYALVYYKLDGMTWTYRGSWTYVIIGLSSGDRENYRLNLYTRTKRAYRIDAVPGNTGRLGTWFYKIGKVSRTPEATCTAWYIKNLLFHPFRQLFFSRLPQCPCSHRDVWQKTRYLWVRARVDNIRKIECYRMNRASSNRFYPVGKECCYSLNRADPNYEQLIVSPPYAGSALAYNPSYWHLREHYQREDKLAHDTCCDINLSDPTLCTSQYYTLRPVGICRADFPFRFTWIFGDPHVITLDEREYTFNGWGEYTLITLASGDSDFVLQGRTTPTVTDSGSPVNATVFTAFGAEENKTRVFVQLDPNTNNSLIIYGDGTDYTRRFQEEGDDFLVDEDDFTLMRDNGSLAVIFPSEIAFSVSIGWTSLVLGVFVPEKFRNQTRGLLGNYNSIKTDDFVLPGGTVLSDTLTDRQIHYQFGNAWSVTEANSVLRYGPKEGYSDYAHSEFTPIFFEEMSASDKQAAENVCGAADRACIYDFVVSGSEGFALKTKACREEAMGENAASQNRLPTLEVPDNVTVTVNVTKTFRVSAKDPGDTVTYKLANDGNGAIRINGATGDITVTLNSNTPVTLKVFAVDTFEAQSVVYTIPLIVCFGCSSHGQCDFTRVQSAVGNMNFQHAACDCSTGWAGASCSEDIDACSSSPCHPLQTCTDQTPAQQASSSVGYTCSACPAGYNSPAGQSNPCLDVDECADDALNECEVTCNNTAGSYQCSCPDGYRLTSDLHSCADINECAEKSHDCQHICNNTDGGYNCLCQEGFDLDSSGECVQTASTQSTCTNSGCSQGCKAVDDPATSSMVASCFCRSGYDLDPINKKTCIDHDECKDNICSHTCSNTQGGFICSCYNGFQLNSDQRTCSQCPSLQYGPECAHTCLCNGRGLDCHSVTGCVCQKGWTGSQCQDDVNECEVNPDVCEEGQVCTNNNGSYTCACQDGYSIDDDGACQDMDECSNDTACGEHQVCRNVPGTFQCSCMSGYIKNNGTCKDIDECALGSDNCQQKCVNVDGSYNCECYYGYRLNTDRATCSQVSDPCAEEENLSCDHGCTLDDTDIAVCFCRSGYTLNSDKQTCQDVNECLDDNKKCSHTCTNTVGGFSCSCPTGMVLDNDGKTCVSCPAGTYGTGCSMNCSCGVGTSRCDAVTGCLCKTGWTGDKCQNDVNECDVNSTRQLCEVNGAECVNLQGGYKCQCASGYKMDDSGVCQDIDECTTSPCSQNCENSVGSYKCLCDAGFTLNSTAGECTRSTTCWQKTCDTSNGGCYVNDHGLETCFCNTGYTLGADGVTCSLEHCDCDGKPNTRCKKSNGNYTCVCKKGFKEDSTGACVYCDCDGTPNTRCKKSNGNYTCVCKKGFKEDSTGACVSLTRLGFTFEVNVNKTTQAKRPSRSTIKKEGQKLLKTMLKGYLPNLIAVSIKTMRSGGVIVEVGVDVPSKSAQISASYLAVALVNITGQSTTLAGQTGTVGITVDGMEILSNTTYCDVFSHYVTCDDDEVCKVENGKLKCRQDKAETTTTSGQAACWDSPVNRHCLNLCCNLLPT